MGEEWKTCDTCANQVPLGRALCPVCEVNPQRDSPINSMVDAVVSCVLCGTSGVGNCDCWEHCSCGWWARAGTPCRNPSTTRCSTKLKYVVSDKE
jgi:hypothetical protein